MGWKQAIWGNFKALDRSQRTVGRMHGLPKKSLTMCPGACPSSTKLPAWLTRALLHVVHHGPRHCGDVDVGHLGAQGDLPEVRRAAAVAASVPCVLLPRRPESHYSSGVFFQSTRHENGDEPSPPTHTAMAFPAPSHRRASQAARLPSSGTASARTGTGTRPRWCRSRSPPSPHTSLHTTCCCRGGA